MPVRTAPEIRWAEQHLRGASAQLLAAARMIKPYSPESSSIALHIEQQAGALADQLSDLFHGLEIVGLQVPGSSS